MSDEQAAHNYTNITDTETLKPYEKLTQERQYYF